MAYQRRYTSELGSRLINTQSQQPVSDGAGWGVFIRIMTGLATKVADEKTIMIDVGRRTPCVRVSLRKYLKAHRTASSPAGKKGGIERGPWLQCSP